MSAAELTAQLSRDRPETPFSRILSAFLEQYPSAGAAVFLDADGECIDYAARMDPYEAMVFGATMVSPTRELVARGQRGAGGQPILWWLETEKFDALVRRVSDEHVLVVWLSQGALSALLLRAMGPLAEQLRFESGVPAPVWDPVGEPIEVELREARGWGYAPGALRSTTGHLEPVDVLGRWTEGSGLTGQGLVCFLVRHQDLELTLVHDPAADRWFRR